MSNSLLSTIDDAIAAVKAGRMVIIVDDEDRENEGDLMIAGEHASPDAINFMATHGRGLICLAMQGAAIDRLQIPMMVPDAQNRSGFGTGFTISVEAASGVSTGISAADRSTTIQTLINPQARPDDIAMPGHVFPLRARNGGVLERRGQTEASVDLSQLAGCHPSGVICEIMRDDGTMMRLEELAAFAEVHQLPLVSIEQLAQYRRAHESVENEPAAPRGPDAHAPALAVADEPSTHDATVTLIGRSKLPTDQGHFEIAVYRDSQGLEHSALIKGDPTQGVPLVRLHSECLTGDAFGSLRCDCGLQLQSAMSRIEHENHGVVLYLRQEGRGIGLGNKIRAYELQDAGRDTVDANLELGFPADARTYDVAAAMLRDLGISALQLMSNNPAKLQALTGFGFDVVSREPVLVTRQAHNEAYLQTKARRMGHQLGES